MAPAVWALLAVCSAAASLEPTGVTRIGASPAAQKYWQPSHLVVLDETTAAVRIMHSEEGTPQDARQHSFAFTTDKGKSFTREDGDNEFCGSTGVVSEGSLTCTAALESFAAPTATFRSVTYEFNDGGVFSNPTVTKRDGPPHTFTLGSSEWSAEGIDPGEASLTLRDYGLHLRNGVVHLRNGSALHVLFSSTDGTVWAERSVIPHPAGDSVTLHRGSGHKLLLSVGTNGSFVEVTSPYLGAHWDGPRNVSATVPVLMFTSPHGNVVYTGPQGRPGLVVGLVGKRGRTPKSFDLTAVHNHYVRKGLLDAAPFSEEYRNTTNFTGCADGTSERDIDGCASSSYVALGALGNDTLLMVYDKLSRGFKASAGEGADEVFAATVFLNETAEIERKRQDEEREERLERARRQAQKDEEERVKRARREKLRRERERRAQFTEADKTFIEAARLESARGDVVVVRDVNPDTVDIEKDTFLDDFH